MASLKEKLYELKELTKYFYKTLSFLDIKRDEDFNKIKEYLSKDFKSIFNYTTKLTNYFKNNSELRKIKEYLNNSKALRKAIKWLGSYVTVGLIDSIITKPSSYLYPYISSPEIMIPYQLTITIGSLMISPLILDREISKFLKIDRLLSPLISLKVLSKLLKGFAGLPIMDFSSIIGQELQEGKLTIQISEWRENYFGTIGKWIDEKLFLGIPNGYLLSFIIGALGFIIDYKIKNPEVKQNKS
jgi:hypothetical protein